MRFFIHAEEDEEAWRLSGLPAMEKPGARRTCASLFMQKKQRRWKIASAMADLYNMLSLCPSRPHSLCPLLFIHAGRSKRGANGKKRKLTCNVHAS